METDRSRKDGRDAGQANARGELRGSKEELAFFICLLLSEANFVHIGQSFSCS